jgi:hypothetical protein
VSAGAGSPAAQLRVEPKERLVEARVRVRSGQQLDELLPEDSVV